MSETLRYLIRDMRWWVAGMLDDLAARLKPKARELKPFAFIPKEPAPELPCMIFGHRPASQTGRMLKSNYVRCECCGELVPAIPSEAP